MTQAVGLLKKSEDSSAQQFSSQAEQLAQLQRENEQLRKILEIKTDSGKHISINHKFSF